MLLIVISSFAFSPKPKTLEYTFKIGDRYTWNQVTHQSIAQHVMGMDQLIENDINSTINMNVMTITANGATIEARYTKFVMNLKLPAGMGAQILDSEGDTSKMENKIMRSMVDKPFTITITKHGNIESIDGEENLIVGFDQLGLSEQQATAMKTSVSQYLSESAIKGSFEMMLTNYPDKKVKAGDTWTNKNQVISSFSKEINNTWTLKEINKGTATVTADGVVTMIDKEKIVELPSNMKANFDLAGTQKITSIINTSTGWPTEVNVASEEKGNMKLLAGGMIPQDMIIPMEVSSKSVFRIEKK